MIPVVDISDAAAGSASPTTVEAVRSAIEQVGFLQVVGHGVPPQALADVYRVSDVLMNLAPAAKQRWTHPHPFRGWERRPATGPMTGQRFQVCDIDSPDEARALGVPEHLVDYFQLNVWPELENLRPAITRLTAEKKRVGEVLMSLFAQALGLDPAFFAPVFVHQVSYFAINYYRGGQRSAGNELALREHKDSGTLTVLHQRGGYEGLQVRMPDGSLVGVPVREDAFVINIGELMERWTNDRFTATKHRVLLPDTAGQTRTSLTLFHGPAIDTVIEPLDACVGAGTAHYDAVTPYDWEGRYFAANGITTSVPSPATV